MRKYAKVVGLLLHDLNEAIQSTGPDRDARIGEAARWYCGLPQIFLRKSNHGSGKNRRSADLIEVRLDHYLSGNYAALLNWWASDCDRANRKRKPQKPSTAERRLRRGVDLIRQGDVSKGAAAVEGLGTGPPNDATKAQMRRKHPQHQMTFGAAPGRGAEADPLDLSKCKRVLEQARPNVGVGPRGLRPGHLLPLIQGQLEDEDAKEAWGRLLTLGSHYFDGSMPPWLRRTLNAGLLTPLVKKAAAEGETPDSRPTNARDMDLSMWTKGIQRAHATTVAAELQPQQLGVNIPDGV